MLAGRGRRTLTAVNAQRNPLPLPAIIALRAGVSSRPVRQKKRAACTHKRVGRSVSDSAGPLPAFQARLARTTQASW